MVNLLHCITKSTKFGWCRAIFLLPLLTILIIFLLLGYLHVVDKYCNTKLLISVNWKLRSQPRWSPNASAHYLDYDFGGRSHQLQDGQLDITTSTLMLLNITDFKFILNPRNACDVQYHGRDTATSTTTNLLMVIIPSSRSYFTSRRLIRSTWGSVRCYQNWVIRRIFLIGAGGPSEITTVQQDIVEEARIHSDIVLGSFQDTYKNMTYKHLMGYKWILEHCSQATFVLKSDDDVMVDIFGVIESLNGILRHTKTAATAVAGARRKYYCAKIHGIGPIRDESSIARKWHVSVEEYPHDVYPSYCGFAAYITTVSVLRSIYATAEEHAREGQFFWIDDVYVTGILRKAYNSRRTRVGHNDPGPPGAGSISIVNTRGRYNWSWEISNATYRQWDRTLRFVVIHRENENGLMGAYWEQIKSIHLPSFLCVVNYG